MLGRQAQLGVVSVLLVLTLVATPLIGGTWAASPAASSEPTTASNAKLVYVQSNGTDQLWPYTSREKDFETLTLPINVVIRTDPGHVRQILAGSDKTNASWETQGPENETVVLNGTDIPWSRADGATRYTYIETETGGKWVSEAYQLHNGTYFGSRVHLRLYEGGRGIHTWTAIQAHSEHFDWFRLRHTVSSVADGREHVEQDFYGSRYLARIERQRYANGGIMDTDGWVTVIDIVSWTIGGPRLTLIPLAVGIVGLGGVLRLGATRAENVVRATSAAAAEVELSRFHLALLVGLAAIPLVVRFAGITLETRTPLGTSPKLIAVMLYPLLAAGLPLIAITVGRPLSAVDGFAFGALGLGLGFVADYAILGVSLLPIAVVLNRVFLLIAVGLLAAGGTRAASDWAVRNRYSAVGGILWLLGLAWPLLELGALVGGLL